VWGTVSTAVWENDGSVFYTDVTATAGVSTAAAETVLVGDVEGDGDTDVLLDYGSRAALFQNTAQHLSTPDVAMLGSSYRLVIHARGGSAALLFLDVRLTPQPIASAIGLQHIDPGTALNTPILPMGEPTRHVDLTMPVVPALAGLVLYSQAVVLRGSVLRWTNAIGDRILW